MPTLIIAFGSVDAWSIRDPYLAIGEREDHLRVLVTSQQFGGEVETGVATDSAIAHKRAELLDFIARVRRAYLWADRHPEDCARLCEGHRASARYRAAVKSRIRIEVEPRASDASIAAHQHAADIYADIGVIPHRLDIRMVHDRSFTIADSS